MPELAEVEFYRRQWNCGLDQKILAVHPHPTKRVFRGTDTKLLQNTLPGAKFLGSQAHGKQMLLKFSRGAWVGIHLGMTGKLRIEKPDFTPDKHDHFVLQQSRQTLVFSDPRQFGRVLFHSGNAEPGWWQKLPPRVQSDEFTLERFGAFLLRHRKAPIKAVLLLQEGFPGVGNWMADEILWQARIHPAKPAAEIKGGGRKTLFQKTCFVCTQALKIIGEDFADPPESWLFQHRWRKRGNCPCCKAVLRHSTIGGRTTCWCEKCQKVNIS